MNNMETVIIRKVLVHPRMSGITPIIRRGPPTRSRNRNKIKKQIAHLVGEIRRVDEVSAKRRWMNDETGRKRSLPFNLCNNGGQYAESRVRAFYQPVLTRWPPGADGGRTLTAPLSLSLIPRHCFWRLRKHIKDRVRPIVIYDFLQILRRPQRVALGISIKCFGRVKRREMSTPWYELLKMRPFLRFLKGVLAYSGLGGVRDKFMFAFSCQESYISL